MSDKVTKALLDELSLLREKLEKTELYKEIQILERMISRRQSHDDSASGDHVISATLLTGSVAAARTTPIPQVKSRVKAILRGAKLPIPIKEIYSNLLAEGVIVPGDSPQNNLSAHMSRDDAFVSWGRSGWTLANEVTPSIEIIQHAVIGYLAEIGEEECQMLCEAVVERGEPVPGEVELALEAKLRNQLSRRLVEAERNEIGNLLRAALQRRKSTDLDDLLGS